LAFPPAALVQVAQGLEHSSPLGPGAGKRRLPTGAGLDSGSGVAAGATSTAGAATAKFGSDFAEALSALPLKTHAPKPATPSPSTNARASFNRLFSASGVIKISFR
jgi:hypothetical protein